eukprot:c14749_g2_i1 orf=351-614(+)
MLRNTTIFGESDDSDICCEIEKCFNDDNDNSEFCKNTLIEEIEDAMNTALVIAEPEAASEETDSENDPTEISAEIDQRDLIHNALQE